MDWTRPTDTFRCDFKFDKDFFLKRILPLILVTLIIISTVALILKYRDHGAKLTYAQLDYGYRVKFIKINNQIGNMAYIDEGTGNQTIVIIHGGNNHIKHYSEQINFLKKTHRVIAVDLPGYGKSTFNKNIKYSLSIHAKAVKKLLKKLKLKNVILMGHSYGCMVAIESSYQENVKIKKLILLSPIGLNKFNDYDVHFLLRWFNTEDENAFWHPHNFRKRYQTLYYKKTLLVEKHLDDFLALIRSGSYNRVNITRHRILNNIIPLLRNFHYKFMYSSLPILIIVGKQDKLLPLKRGSIMPNFPTPAEFFKPLEMVNPHCTVKLINNCGHMPNLEHPHKVNVMIKQFLNN